jgi:hypothetical protein
MSTYKVYYPKINNNPLLNVSGEKGCYIFPLFLAKRRAVKKRGFYTSTLKGG